MKKIIPNLFFLFLTSPILSPFLFGMTLYLSAIVLFFDLFFLKWLQKTLTWPKIYQIIFLLLLLSVASYNPVLIVKTVMLLTSATYGYYCYITHKFYLYRWITFNVVIAVFQFILVFVNYDLALIFGPENISRTVWGPLAGPSYSNFYAISLLPRVSGLSREGGFFAALLGVSFFTLLYDKYLPNKKPYYWIFFVGFMISMSKAALMVFIIPLIVLSRRYLNVFGIFAISLCYCLILTILCYYINSNTDFFLNFDNITFTHRFSGYMYAPYAEIQDFFAHISLSELLDKADRTTSAIKDLLRSSKLEFCGLPSLYFSYGIQTFLIFLLTLKFFKFNALGFLMVIIFTINVTPLTSDGFVIVAWLLGFIVAVNESTIKQGQDHAITF